MKKGEKVKEWKDEEGWKGEKVKRWKDEEVKGWKDEEVKGWKAGERWNSERVKRWKDEEAQGWKDGLAWCSLWPFAKNVCLSARNKRLEGDKNIGAKSLCCGFLATCPYVLLSKSYCVSGRKEKGWKGGLRQNAEHLVSLCTKLFYLPSCYDYEVILLHVSWNMIPVYMERNSSLYGTGFQLTCNSAVNEKTRYKG